MWRITTLDNGEQQHEYIATEKHYLNFSLQHVNLNIILIIICKFN